MKTSIATVSVSGDFREKLDAIAAAGFDGIEIFEQDFIAFDGSPRDVGNMIRDHGLEISLFQPFRDFEGLPEPLRAKAFDRAERKFDLMQELGTDLVLVCSSCHPQALGGIDRAAADFHALGERAAKRGLRVGYEALCWGKHVNDHRDAWEIVRRADHPNIGVILDSFHTLARKISPDSIRSIPGNKIFFVQMADAPMIDMDLLYWSRHFRNMPGEGDLDVTGFTRAVMAAGYTGPISLEIFNDHFRGSNTKQVANDGYRSLIALMDDVHRAEPGLKLNLPTLPQRVKPEGVSFIEFASRGKEAETLGELLKTLGFAHAATHRNKAVTLWQQGDIRLVVNEETDGHAAHAYNARGTTVCDLGILVNAAQDVINRATATGAQSFSQDLDIGELDIPAIKGLGGSVMHFIDKETGLDRVWKVEFRAEEAPDLTGVGLMNIDHIAQTMSYEDMLSWTLFYTAIFDVNKSPMVDVIDPDGLVRSQVIETRDGAFRITLNGADTHRTLAGRFLADTFGASVQHIALATADIFDTAARLAERGFAPLPISPNYYDDLAARFDFPPGLLEKMKAAHVLYDRDEKGEFFQLYSGSFAGGLFFEILQRGSYMGFGAPNAPFRIAAQKRRLRPKGMPLR
ncbi:bifunctional sugar phosphate isomerase/epimerase/4-hydroxyphenylpyruvate dioxygenase family protein [Sulfitobacter sp. M22]|jgi:4-hydroxyphenylpyruvate dioxygenase|uniref:bifunctional sugar phosphate isomerase/epimerase/4-hydroxyphenylpyruvate dioxygenase family protein n=1 Tax=Sulfitobacter sp. M22 TaxID=2675332 RepID=UPI001F3CF85F|nr:sugar phosphate isomerase/epimerase and 4-hydroxyphenylpyruvate domain-containing protein [Sulfitobacter sp. M22]MCF7728437.1 TIM barrel protein [Sulfitobacter sp. M22]|tara:strand:+ start:2282 stop:4168 length:1887 start_codon:yes stop_codon:yes gene_type:complete